MLLRILGLLVGLLSIVSALSATGSKLLVILEDESDRNKYSQLWGDLENRGFKITTHSPKDTFSLFLHGEPAYSHLLILPPKSKGLGPALTPNLIVDFVNAGSNVLLALSSEHAIPSSSTNLLLELDISLSPDRNSLVIDHFNYDTKSASEKHDVLLLQSPDFSKREGGVKNFFGVDSLIALPHSVGQVLGNTSPLLTPILKAPATSYIHNPKFEDSETGEELFATGQQINLVSAFQARNSARFTVLGSAEALEDKWFTATVQLPGSTSKSEKASNRAFAEKLTAWTFKETGVLKVGPIRHWLNEPPQKGIADNANAGTKVDLNPSIYRIKNDVHYSIQLSEWSQNTWLPFVPPSPDTVQLEVSMLSPFHRLNLSPLPSSKSINRINAHNSTLFVADFTLPDQHGIFNFFVEYRRPFYTDVEEKTTVTVRHFAHDEWPRSFVISAAWPWMAGIWVTVLGWLGFVGVWLFSRPMDEVKKRA